jgi:hypothetical protein
VPKAEFILHNGVQILVLDVKGSKDMAQNIAAFRLAQKLATNEPLKSVRLLTDVTGAHYDSEGVAVMKEFSKATTPYNKASAVVGVEGMKWIIVQSLIKLTGRDIKLFDTRDKALDWLAGQ